LVVPSIGGVGIIILIVVAVLIFIAIARAAVRECGIYVERSQVREAFLQLEQ
jgi:hypothetical protein